MTRLNDNDWRVYAAHQLGGVKRRLRHTKSGVIIEHYTLGDEDVTQSVTRLQRAKKLEWLQVPLHLDDESLRVIATRTSVALHRRPIK